MIGSAKTGWSDAPGSLLPSLSTTGHYCRCEVPCMDHNSQRPCPNCEGCRDGKELRG